MSFSQTNLNVASVSTSKHSKIVFNSIKSKNSSFNNNSLPKKQHKRVFHIHKLNKQQHHSTPSSSVVDINDKKEDTLLTEDNNNNNNNNNVSTPNAHAHNNSLSDLAATNVHCLRGVGGGNSTQGASSMIFLINKKTKRIDIANQTNEPSSNSNTNTNTNIIKHSGSNNIMGNIRLTHPKNEIFIDDLKKKIKNTFYNQNALDLRLIKTYHQLLLEEKNQMYFSPTNSDDESDHNNNPSTNANTNHLRPSPPSPKTTEEEKTNTNNTYTKYTIIMGLSKKVHCNCKKSNCLKNYCECKRNHERCDKKCECEQCKNINFNITECV